MTKNDNQGWEWTDYLNQAVRMSIEIFGERKLAREWMEKPNDYFFGDTPTEACLKGNGQSVVTLLQERAGKNGKQSSTKASF